MITLWVVITILLLFGLAAFIGAPYVPSLRREVRAAFTELYPISDSDVVADLGSGDGVVLLEAAAKGAKGYGYEINPVLVLISKLRLGTKASIKMMDMWSVTLPDDVTLVYIFSVSRDAGRLADYLQTQANVRSRELTAMTFGAPLRGLDPVATRNGHSLYKIRPQASER